MTSKFEAKNKSKVKLKNKNISLVVIFSMAITSVFTLIIVSNDRLAKRIFNAELANQKTNLNVDIINDDLSALKSFISNNSKQGKVYLPLIELSNKEFKDSKKLPTYYLCANDEFNSVIKFSPNGYFHTWSEIKGNLKIVQNTNRSETGYYTIADGKIKSLMFDRGKTQLAEFKIKKVNKYNVITELEILGITLNSEQCPKEIYLLN